MATIAKAHILYNVKFLQGATQADAIIESKRYINILIIQAEIDDGGTWKFNLFFEGNLVGPGFVSYSKLNIS